MKEDVENEWKPRVESLEGKLAEKSVYIEELEKALEREKQVYCFVSATLVDTAS